jgi:2-(1,2-epoxy-1,2-dihydrophenyl)acetyl-CoA isomerase
MGNRSATDLARALYAALASGDRSQLDALLHPEFTGRIAEGMPFGIGGDHDGPAAMRRNGWGAIARISWLVLNRRRSSISPIGARW